MARSRSLNGTPSKKAGARRKPEDEFLKQVIAYAKIRGWKTAHFRPGMMANGHYVTAGLGDFKGFPDLVMVRGKILYFAELKAGGGRLSDEQRDWINVLNECAAPVTCFVWYPKDWDSVQEILA